MSVLEFINKHRVKPILFQTEMIQAERDGRKIETRRTRGLNKINENPDNWECRRTFDGIAKFVEKGNALNENFVKCPYWSEYGFLWVRETWQHTECLNINFEDENYGYVYRADDDPWDDYEGWRWKPSIFMPKEACRTILKITDINVERVQNISEESAVNEGITLPNYAERTIKDVKYPEPSQIFESLWKSINGEESWYLNPWVWVIKFKRVQL